MHVAYVVVERQTLAVVAVAEVAQISFIRNQRIGMLSRGDRARRVELVDPSVTRDLLLRRPEENALPAQ